MKSRNFIRLVAPYIPMLISILGALGVILGLHLGFPVERLAYLDYILYILTILSALLSIVILGFIINKAASLETKGNALREEIKHYTQQVHYFRDIADLLLQSQLWAPGLKEYLDKEFAGLNYFDIKEFYKGRNKLALEYIEQNNRFGQTESLYLEIKSLLLNHPAQSVVDDYANPKEYDLKILEKWDEHHVGNGIYHYFGFKYVNFKDELDVNRITETHQDRILEYAIQIDTLRYQEMGFSEELLSKLGLHLSEEIIPYLRLATQRSVKRLPLIINVSFVLLTALVIFGIFQPITILLFGLAPIFGFVSIAAVVGVFLFLLLAIYPYVAREINKEE